MIKLTKVGCPAILVANGALWTKTLVDKKAAGVKPTNTEKARYRHPQIKAALVEETSGKCAYCESKLLHIHHGDVEHIMPKSLELDKILVWENLTLACEICNQNKSFLDPNASEIIDPYVDDPGDHLFFWGSIVIPRGTAKGTNSRAILGLNRGELVERRKEKVEKLGLTLDTILRNDLPLAARIALWIDLVTNEAGASSAYAAMAKSFCDDVRQHLHPDIAAAA